ncbi:MAG: hypothetical protein ABIC96_00630 [Patescibacteria group bacterium]
MAIKKKKKETTIGDLSKKIDVLAVSMEKGFKLADEKMEAGFKRSDERLETAINGLALMIGKGFEHVDKRISSLDRRMDSLEQGQENIIKSNAREHEELKLRQDEVPYRFEFVELEKRVEVLERMR